LTVRIDWDATPFREVELIGRGGMGAVYGALDSRIGRRVALKIQGHDSSQALARFRREGQLAAALQHPNVVQIHEVFQVPQGDVLVCELVADARSLAEAWAPLELRGRVALLRDAAAGVAAAHAAGIVHRDLKPDNVLVDGQGRARVADFGVAYNADLERLTQTGAMVGTPSFMAPEQFSGTRSPTAACDVWALGVLLYLALTNELPFAGESVFEVAASVTLGTTKDQKRGLTKAPLPLRNVVLRCLRPAPAERFADASMVRDALQAWLDDPVLQTASRRALSLTVGVGLVLALGVGGWAAVGSQPTPTPLAAPSTASPRSSEASEEDPAPRGLVAQLDAPSAMVAGWAEQRLIRRYPGHPRAKAARASWGRRLWRPLLTVAAPGGAQGEGDARLARAGRFLGEGPDLVTFGPSDLRVWRPGRELEVHLLPPLRRTKLAISRDGTGLFFSSWQSPVAGLLRVSLDGSHTWIGPPSGPPLTSAFFLPDGRFVVGGKGEIRILSSTGKTLERVEVPGEIVRRVQPFRGGALSMGVVNGADPPRSWLRVWDSRLRAAAEPVLIAGNNSRIAPSRDESRLLIANAHYAKLSVRDMKSGAVRTIFSPTLGGRDTSSVAAAAWVEGEERCVVFSGAKEAGARVECWDTTREGVRLWRRDLPPALTATFAGPGPDFLFLGFPDKLQVLAISPEGP